MEGLAPENASAIYFTCPNCGHQIKFSEVESSSNDTKRNRAPTVAAVGAFSLERAWQTWRPEVSPGGASPLRSLPLDRIEK